jgi:hypothetical protein
MFGPLASRKVVGVEMAYTFSISNPRSNPASTVQKSAKPMKLKRFYALARVGVCWRDEAVPKPLCRHIGRCRDIGVRRGGRCQAFSLLEPRPSHAEAGRGPGGPPNHPMGFKARDWPCSEASLPGLDGTVSPMWRPLEAHRRPRRSHRDGQAPHPSRLVHQRTAPCYLRGHSTDSKRPDSNRSLIHSGSALSRQSPLTFTGARRQTASKFDTEGRTELVVTGVPTAEVLSPALRASPPSSAYVRPEKCQPLSPPVSRRI